MIVPSRGTEKGGEGGTRRGQEFVVSKENIVVVVRRFTEKGNEGIREEGGCEVSHRDYCRTKQTHPQK